MDVVTEVGEEAEGAVPYTGIIRMWPRTGALGREFLKLFLGSKLFARQIEVAKTGATIQHFGPKHLNAMFMVLPPRTEQDAIVQTVARSEMQVRHAVRLTKELVVALREYRRALVTAAVTGQLNIPPEPAV